MFKRLSFALIAVSVVGSAFAQGDPDTLTKIIEEGKVRNKARVALETITGEFGARLTSSQALEKAQAWAMEQFKSYGCVNVHLEKWGPFAKGWNLDYYSGHMLEPQYQPIIAMPVAWTNGTGGVVTGNPMLVRQPPHGSCRRRIRQNGGTRGTGFWTRHPKPGSCRRPGGRTSVSQPGTTTLR